MKIAILGAGRVGLTLKKLLDNQFEIIVGDQKSNSRDIFAVDTADRTELCKFLSGASIVISAADFTANKQVASAAVELGVHYVDLTEDVETTNFVRSLEGKAQTSLIPQCGLAPGAIDIVGAHLLRQFEKPLSLKLRVGALPLYPANRMSYYLSWNTAGLLNEYIHPCEAIVEGQKVLVKPLEGLEKIEIDGYEYEAFNTSGGAGTLVDTFAGKVRELDYKTIRYPGHVDYLRFMFEDLGLRERMDLANEIFNHNVPTTEDDVVVFFAKATGYLEGKLTERNWVRKIYGKDDITAIQLSTASGAAEVVSMLGEGLLKPGFVKQEDLSFERFIKGEFGCIFA